MGLDKDAELRKLQEEIRREREKVERLQREVNERVAREAKAKQGKGGWGATLEKEEGGKHPRFDLTSSHDVLCQYKNI